MISFLANAKQSIDYIRIKNRKLGKLNVNVSFNLVNKDTSSRIINFLPVRNWTTTIFKTEYLSADILQYLAEQIRSKVIQNGESGSKITFSHFVSLRMIVTNIEDSDSEGIFGGKTDDLEIFDVKKN